MDFFSSCGGGGLEAGVVVHAKIGVEIGRG